MKKNLNFCLFYALPGPGMSGRRASLQACPGLNVDFMKRSNSAGRGGIEPPRVVFRHPHFWGWMLSLETKLLIYFCFKVTI